ncbi:MAG: phosphatase PAP2 family protein [Planctomycetota bacterium]|nr:phosphatase PAP2 family protein [Planctomycetota bacterium]
MRWLDRRTPAQERALLTLVVLVASLGYVPIGALSVGRAAWRPETVIDEVVPFVPAGIFVYVWLYPMAVLPLVALRDRLLLRRVVLAYLVVDAISYASFLLVPVRFDARGVVEGTSTLATWGITLAHWADPPSNCFPSLHVSISYLAALAVGEEDRRLGRRALAIATAIALSTMVVKQHWLADVVAGAALGALAWWVFLRGRGVPANTSHTGVRLLVLAQVLVYVAAWSVYRAGWAPWEGSATAYW